MFVGTVDARQVEGEQWMLLAPLVWSGADWQITVPAGFVTNFANIPRILWWLWPRSGSWNPAAVVHDFECRTQFRPAREVHQRFGLMLKTLDQPWIRRTPMALGVQQFGPTWNSMRVPGMPYEVGPGGLMGVPEGYVSCAP